MNKIIFTLFIFLFSLSFVNATDYSTWEHISVDSLPTASSSTTNVIYDHNNKYYVTTSSSGGNVRFETGDVLNGHFYFYEDNLQANLYDNLVSNDCKDGRSSCKFFTGGTGSDYYNLYIDSFVNMIVFKFFNGSYGGGGRLNSCSGCTFEWLDSNTLHFFSSNAVGVFGTYYANSYPASILYKSISGITYSWEEISYYDWYVLSEPTESDFYLFYTFDDISSFDIFDWVDFVSFTDFQKLVITIGINIFYVGFLGLCIYIILKSIYKLLSMIF